MDGDQADLPFDITEDELQKYVEEFLERERNDKRPFLTLKFGWQLQYAFLSERRERLGKCVGADWNTKGFRQGDFMERFGVSMGVWSHIVGHASMFVTLFGANARHFEPADSFASGVRELFDFKTSIIAGELKTEIGDRYRIRWMPVLGSLFAKAKTSPVNA